MILPPWHEEAIARTQDRESFDCGDPALNTYLRQHARRSHEQGGAKTFLAIEGTDGTTILGFYSVSPASIAYNRTPDLVRRGLARYEVLAFRLARLAVALPIQGRGSAASSCLSPAGAASSPLRRSAASPC